MIFLIWNIIFKNQSTDSESKKGKFLSAEISGDEAYGMSIIITKLNGKENVVIFRQNAANMLHSFYN